MTDIDKNRENWLAEQLDRYVHFSSDKEAEEFLASQADKELIELCGFWKDCLDRHHKDKCSKQPRCTCRGFRGTQKKSSRNKLSTEIVFVLGTLFAVFMLLYAGVEMATLKRENRDLRKQMWELVGEQQRGQDK